MLKNIFIQLWNRRRTNIWMLTELLLVFCLLWYIVDYLFVLQYNYHIPDSRNFDHTWKVSIKSLPAGHPDYIEGASDSTALEANFERLLDRIRNDQTVEAIAVLEKWGSPGSGSYWGAAFRNVSDTTRSVFFQNVSFDPRTDFFRVFHYTKPDGKIVSADDFDWDDPHTVILDEQAANILFPNGDAFGKKVSDKTNEWIVKGVVGNVKRFNYLRPQITCYTSTRVTRENISNMIIAIRSKESIPEPIFQQDFQKRMEKELRIGNFYMEQLKSYKRIKAETDTLFGITSEIRIKVSMSLFFLLNIMLCLIGSFWYRIRVYRGEIGLRMAMGATRTNIRNLYLLEGLCLLAIVVIPAMFIEAQFVRLGLIETLGYQPNAFSPTRLPDRTVLRFMITNLLTFGILAIATIVAIWIPACRAAETVPAEVLHEE